MPVILKIPFVSAITPLAIPSMLTLTLGNIFCVSLSTTTPDKRPLFCAVVVKILRLKMLNTTIFL